VCDEAVVGKCDYAAHDGNRLDFLRVVELGSVGFSHFGPANRKLFEFLKPNDWLAAKPK
jgi:hypothetical protein